MMGAVEGEVTVGNGSREGAGGDGRQRMAGWCRDLEILLPGFSSVGTGGGKDQKSRGNPGLAGHWAGKPHR